MFKALKFRRQISFSLCDVEYFDDGEKGYLDCFYITEFTAGSKEESMLISSNITKIPYTTIYYKPPKHWDWLKKGNKFYLVYSNTYEPSTTNFRQITDIVKEVYQIEGEINQD